MERNVETYEDLFPDNIDKIIEKTFKEIKKQDESYINESEFDEFLTQFLNGNSSNYNDNNNNDNNELRQKLKNENYFFCCIPKNETKMNIFNFKKAYKELWLLTNLQSSDTDIDINIDI